MPTPMPLLVFKTRRAAGKSFHCGYPSASSKACGTADCAFAWLPPGRSETLSPSSWPG